MEFFWQFSRINRMFLTRLSIPKLFGEHLFDVWYGQRDEVPRKPAPDGALMIARELLVQPSQCLFIGDSDVDMHTGIMRA